MMDGTYTATVDRIEDGETAVVLVEDDGEVAAQFDVPVDELPADARREGSVLTATVEDDRLVDATYDEAATEERRESVRDRLDRLSDRLSER